MLLSSVGLDKYICFFDIQEKKVVKKNLCPITLQSVSFCCDGFTLAVGGSSQKSILIYDVNNSNFEIAKKKVFAKLY